MNQPDLFSIPNYMLHRKGQQTSKAALEKTEKPRESRQRKIFDALKKYGQTGAIPEDLVVPTKEDLIDVRRAFCVLKKLGKIEPTGEERPNDKGNACEVWRAKP